LKNIIVGGFIVIVLLLPWHIRQYYVYNRIMLFSPEWTNLKKGDPLPKCNYQSYDQYYKSLTKNDLLHANNEYYIHLFTPQKLEEMKLKNTFNQKYPFITRAIGFFEIVRFDFRFGYGNDTRISPPNIYGPKQLIRTIYNLIFLGSMLLLMFPGIYYSIRQRNMFMKIIAVYIFTHIIIHSWAHYIERYRLTIVPLIFIIGWYGLIQLINNLSIIKQENNSKPEIR